MSSRSTLRSLGLALLVPSAAMGMLPLVAAQTDLLSSWSNFSWEVGSHVIVRYTDNAGAGGDARVNPVVWVFAALGEAILIGVHLARPVRKSRYTLRHH